MVTPNVAHLKVIPTKSVFGGNGLEAIQHIVPSEAFLHVERPLVAELDIPRLKDTCYHCFEAKQGHNLTLQETDTRSVKLKLCSGCKIVRYCSRDCQGASWDAHHMYECKIFGRLPRALPSNVRCLMRLLILHEKNRVKSEEWDAFLGLESHLDDFISVGGARLENMYLMARAAKEYSGTHVTVEYVLSLLARIMINSFTLVTPTFDPIGIILHPLPSMMNHSCDYNAYVRCHKNGAMDVVAIKPISQAEEVRISYIDSTFPTRIRQKELKDNYFFDCKCSKCQDTNNCDFSPDILTNDKISEVLAIESRINDILKSSNYTDTSSFLRKLENAFHVLHSHGNWPLHQQPFPQVRHSYIVSLIASKQFTTAFAQASIQRSRIDPKIYPQDIHPLRTVHDLVLLKLIDLVSEAAEGESPPQTRTDLRRYEFDYVALRIGLLDVLTNRNPSGDQGHSELKEMIDEAEKSVTLDVRQRVTETAIAAQWQKVERLNEDELEREKGFRYVV